ncbi:polysaccharide deacetylase family protein [Phreatobacter sp.]|uniref:polysaccharide deacetylase family protein n=1 Tax=Phreatobacter sp. TaxID=1966341 RepID=UPI003F6EAE27
MPGTRLARLEHALARRLPFRRAPMRKARPVVSFTFDDFPLSAATHGAPLLERAGGRGTYYVASGLLDTATEHWQVAGPDVVRDLHARGHEIGLHTHSHRPLPEMRMAAFEADLANNRATLHRLVPDLADTTFAYPFGLTGIAHKRRIGRHVPASRSIQPGINRGSVDLDFLLAHELIDAFLSPAEVSALIDDTSRNGGWLIFFSHDVSDRPGPFGVSPGLLTHAIAEAGRNDLAILPVRQALDHFGLA